MEKLDKMKVKQLDKIRKLYGEENRFIAYFGEKHGVYEGKQVMKQVRKAESKEKLWRARSLLRRTSPVRSECSEGDCVRWKDKLKGKEKEKEKEKENDKEKEIE